jgi:hypothetical protein
MEHILGTVPNYTASQLRQPGTSDNCFTGGKNFSSVVHKIIIIVINIKDWTL